MSFGPTALNPKSLRVARFRIGALGFRVSGLGFRVSDVGESEHGRM